MKKTLSFKMLLAALATLMVLACMAIITTPVHAAPIGKLMSNPVEVTFGQTYQNEWSRTSDHLNCYNRFTVNETGFVTITTTKPYDYEGEYGSVEFYLYDSAANLIWSHDSEEAKKSASTTYSYSFGLQPGVYVLNMKPGFYVYSGNIDTQYSFSFKADPYAEHEGNGTTGTAMKIKLNQYYNAIYSDNTPEYKSEYDFYQFEVTKGTYYKIKIQGYDSFDATTTYVYWYNPGDEKSGLHYGKFKYVDEDGAKYAIVKANKDGVGYVQIGDSIWLEEPETYKICVERVGSKNGYITKGKTTYKVLSDSEVALYKTETTATKYTIPETVDLQGINFKVTTIWKNAFRDNATIQTLSIPSSISTIGSAAFKDCTALTTIKGLGDCKYLFNIPAYAFDGCKNLRAIKIPRYLEYIGKYAFRYNYKLKLCDLSNNIGLKEIHAYAFYKCTSLTSIEFPSLLEKIYTGAFMNCTNLKTVKTDSNNIYAVGKDVFKGCKTVTFITWRWTIDEYKVLFRNSGATIYFKT